MNINNIRIFPTSGKTKLKASASVTLSSAKGEIEIRGFRIIESGNNMYWVAPPVECYEKNGEKKYKDSVVMSDPAKSEVYSSILLEFNKINS